jgi:hypothetical protein
VTYRHNPSGPTEIALRRVLITVLEASNERLRYVVRRGFLQPSPYLK